MSHRPVALVTYPNEMEARMLAQLLESEGIASYVQALGAGYGALGVTQFIPHRIFVSPDNIEKAKEILESMADEDLSTDAVPSDEPLS